MADSKITTLICWGYGGVIRKWHDNSTLSIPLRCQVGVLVRSATDCPCLVFLQDPRHTDLTIAFYAVSPQS